MSLKAYHHLLNVGVVDADKLHRVDLERVRLATETQTNLLCDSVGKAWLRAGTEYLSATASSGKARLIPFIAGQDAAFQLELTDYLLRVRDGSDDSLVTRASVSTAVTNGDFSSGTGWTLASTSGQSTTISGGKLNLTARAHGGEAKASRSVTVAGGDQNVEHGLLIVVDRGPVTFRCGSTSGGDEYIAETTLRKGSHSLAFTPTGGTVYVQFSSQLPILKIVDSITIEAAGVVTLPTVWPVADLSLIRYDQSLDVMFLAARGYKQQRIERRSDTSWSVCDYDVDDGPFLSGRTANVTLTPGATEGNTTLTASAPFFKAAHEGALFRLYHKGQTVHTYVAAENQFTPAIMVTGLNETNYNDRDFTWTTAGTWTATIKVQRSFEVTADYRDPLTGYQPFRREQASSTVDITTNTTLIDDDNEDNVTAFYRMGIEAGDYTSGEAEITMVYDGGGGFGIGRVTAINSDTSADIEVLVPFKGTTAVEDWREGEWSDQQGWPTGLAFDEGRLIFVGDDAVWGSISDAYESFDENFIGDAGPLLRAIALGGRNEARWALALSELLVGTDARLARVSSSSLDEIMTPTNFKVKNISDVGVAALSPARAEDDRAIMVGSSGVILYEVSYAPDKGRFLATQISKLTTTPFMAGITEMAVSRQPDQRVWILTESGDAVCLVYNPAEKVVAFIPISTSIDTDVIESVCVLPGSVQDRVYFSIKRVVNGVTVRYVEKLALDSEAKPATVTKCMDSCVYGTGAHSATVDVAHLEAATVVAWVDGAPVLDANNDPVEYTVSSGQITLGSAPTAGFCVGLPYTGRYKSARLEYGAPNATPMLTNKSVSRVGLLLADYARSGVKVGGEFDNANHPLRGLGTNANGTTATNVVAGVVPNEYPAPINTNLSLDTRICIEVASPSPCTIRGLVLEIEHYGG